LFSPETVWFLKNCEKTTQFFLREQQGYQLVATATADQRATAVLYPKA